MAEQDWQIARASPHCQGCTIPFEPGQAYFSVLTQSAGALARQDFCPACFQQQKPPDIFYFWKSSMPTADSSAKPARPVLDPEFILDFMRRLDGERTPQRIAFRYILALMLTRKKVLLAEGGKTDAAGNNLLFFREKGGGPQHEVLEPALTAEEIAAVSAELGTLLGLPAPAKEKVQSPEAGNPGAATDPAAAGARSETLNPEP